MHRLRSGSTVLRFRLGACMLVCQWLITAGALGTLAYAYYKADRPLALYAVTGLLAGMMMFIATWLLVSRANCPLCMMPVLGNKGCAKHGKAKKALGSHRMRVALSILCKNSFVCPYCMEATAVKVREKGGNRVKSSRMRI